MLRKFFVATGVLACGAAIVLSQNTSPITGQWTLGGPPVGDITEGMVRLTIQRTSATSNMNSSSPVAVNQLRGLTRGQLDSSGVVARFELPRDAGTFRFEGYLQHGSGGGTFTFSPNPNFAAEMGALGFSGLTDEKTFMMAVHDVSAAWVREMNALGIRPESSDQLITMRIHNVTVEYIKDFRALGYSNLTPDRLVTMRIHGVTPDFARDLKANGYTDVSPDQMVTMRIHGASLAFIKDVAALGYSHPSIDQLVTMRIHGVTPDYIRKTRSLGMGTLTIDQLVSLRIHGIVE